MSNFFQTLAFVVYLSPISIMSTTSFAQEWTHPIPEPATLSSERSIDLAQHLKHVGAKFFGAYWCPACKVQMGLFGKRAGKKLIYIECGKPKKFPDQTKQCYSQNIKTIPTWIMPDGKRLEGVQSLQQLGLWSEFTN